MQRWGSSSVGWYRDDARTSPNTASATPSRPHDEASHRGEHNKASQRQDDRHDDYRQDRSQTAKVRPYLSDHQERDVGRDEIPEHAERGVVLDQRIDTCAERFTEVHGKCMLVGLGFVAEHVPFPRLEGARGGIVPKSCGASCPAGLTPSIRRAVLALERPTSSDGCSQSFASVNPSAPVGFG